MGGDKGTVWGMVVGRTSPDERSGGPFWKGPCLFEDSKAILGASRVLAGMPHQLWHGDPFRAVTQSSNKSTASAILV